MKRKIYHPSPSDAELNGPSYWRSIDELNGSKEFQQWVDQEFSEGAAELNDTDRRDFLKIMAASFGLAGVGMTGCRVPERRVYPYTQQPEYVIPGVATYYSTSMQFGDEHIPLVVETHQARPTKIEGNPSYKPSGGGTNLFAQSSVLDLYDPDRSRGHRDSSGKTLSREDIITLISEKSELHPDGSGLGILIEPSSSPTRARLVAEIRKSKPKAIISEYSAIDNSNPTTAATELFFSPDSDSCARPLLKLDQAKRILSLDSDFASTDPNSLSNARGYASGRRIKSAKEAKKMSRLYAVESNLSQTGANADHRLRVSTSNIPSFTQLLASFILNDVPAPVGFSESQFSWAKECALDLKSKSGASIVVAGSHLPVDVHKLVFAINEKLGALGKTIEYLKIPSSGASTIEDLEEALKNEKVKTLFILGGNPSYNTPGNLDWSSVQAKSNVIRLGYSEDETSSPASGKKPTLIAQSHYLESWGDGRTWTGTLVPVQPMLEPLFDGFSEIEVLSHIAGVGKTHPKDLVKQTFAEVTGSSDDRSFGRWLAEGVFRKSEYEVISSRPDSALLSSISKTTFNFHKLSINSLDLRFVPSPHTWDGSYANNGWAQECPHPITKITWDNPILISYKLAEEVGGIIPDQWSMSSKEGVLGQNINQLVPRTNEFNRGREVAPIAKVSLPDGTFVEGPIHVQPGIADYTLILPLGHGRTKSGRIGTGSGFDYNPIRSSQTSSSIKGATLKLTSRTHKLANTQEHWSMEGRAIIREASAEEYYKNPDFTSKLGIESHSPNLFPKIKDTTTGEWREMTVAEKAKHGPRGNSAYHPPKTSEIENKSDRLDLLIPGRTSKDGLFDSDPSNDEISLKGHQQWGMAIDFNTCLGCSACVVACQSENNIPIVGKDQVLRGREMHWMRIDRYFASNDYREDNKPDKTKVSDDVQVNFQGVSCMQCEKAPCESVCPVNATVHDDQGLNTMAYNRCIGTRYCANNCPYKVRRFNFLDYNKRQTDHLYEGPLGPAGVNELHQMQKNPDVTLRMRGVMEKCTYCVQRIQEAKINHKSKNPGSGDVLVPDGTIKTACQMVCPTDAITFGDITDENSEVYKMKNSDRNYAVLGYLDIRPRTTYLSKIRNPNPLMPDAYDKPLGRKEYEARYGH